MTSTVLQPLIGTLSLDLLRSLSGSFARILGGLYAHVACRFREPRLAALVVPLRTRFNRISNRLQRLLALLATGRLPRTRPSRPGQPGGKPPKDNLPCGHGWAIHAFGYHVAGRASQLSHLMAQPEMIAPMNTVPALGRIIRPLCHALGLTPTGVRKPGKSAKPRPRPWHPPPHPANWPPPGPLAYHPPHAVFIPPILREI